MIKKTRLLSLTISLLTLSYTSNAQYVIEQLKLNPNGDATVTELTPTDSFLYFRADLRRQDIAPWKSDGTRAGSQRIRTFIPGSSGSLGVVLGVIKDKVLFTATDHVHGFEPWITDGDSIGTKMIKDIYTGSPNSINTNIPSSGVIGNKLYFVANDGPHGLEPWMTDGTASGTMLIKDISPGTKGSHPSRFVAYNGKIYFTADDGTHGSELWETDGTAVGTKMVIDASQGGAHGYINHLMVYNNKLYYTGYLNTKFGLIQSDGTAAGTKIVAPVGIGSNVGKESNIVIFNGKMFFGGADTTTPTNGIELWESDGTTAGTKKVKEINPLFGKSSDPRSLTIVGNKLFFVAEDGVHHEELWVTDGTTNGTKMVKDISNHKVSGSKPYGLTKYGNKLFFRAIDSAQKGGIYVSDGTLNGTYKIKGFTPATWFNPMADFTVYNGSLFFTAYENGYKDLWKLTDTTLNNNPPTNIVTTKNNSEEISIVPNPAHDEITVSFEQSYKNVTVNIIDMSGKLVRDVSVPAAKHSISINLKNIPSGVYIVDLKHSRGHEVQKLIVR